MDRINAHPLAWVFIVLGAVLVIQYAYSLVVLFRRRAAGRAAVGERWVALIRPFTVLGMIGIIMEVLDDSGSSYVPGVLIVTAVLAISVLLVLRSRAMRPRTGEA